jgi:hypothetical protein
LGIALVNNSQSSVVNYTLQGYNCSTNQVFNGLACQNITDNLNEKPISGTLGVNGATVYARYTVSSTVRQVNFASPGTGLQYNITVGYGATPTQVVVNGIQYPQVGDWNVKYHIEGPVDANYTINMPNVTESCNATTAGSNCQWPLSKIVSSIATPAALIDGQPLWAGHWVYYEVTTTTPDPLWVSVQSPQGSDKFDVYVREGTIPVPEIGGYLVKNCNYPGKCGYVTIINLNDTASALPAGTVTTYYIGINSSPNTNITYSIWFSSTCAPGCINNEESGVCTFTGATVGQCSCEDGYMGFDCTLPNGTLPTQYIVLIIIASLVVLSALIGFFAWAYMQRKREGYSSLS